MLCFQGRVQIAVSVLEPELPAQWVGAYVEHCSAHGMLETTQSELIDHVRLPGALGLKHRPWQAGCKPVQARSPAFERRQVGGHALTGLHPCALRPEQAKCMHTACRLM